MKFCKWLVQQPNAVTAPVIQAAVAGLNRDESQFVWFHQTATSYCINLSSLSQFRNPITLNCDSEWVEMEKSLSRETEELQDIL